jgi:hypothetical protein
VGGAIVARIDATVKATCGHFHTTWAQSVVDLSAASSNPHFTLRRAFHCVITSLSLKALLSRFNSYNS